jgi:hypothetical protein
MRNTILALFFCGCSQTVGVETDAGKDAGAVDMAHADASTDAGTVDLAIVDMTAAPSDLACNPFIVDPVQEMSCLPGQEQISRTPTACYHKICGCMDQATCSNCYWTGWIQMPCS